MRPIIVRQGDYLLRLAVRHGFDPETVWRHPANRALRELRPDPNQLAPGDVIQVPPSPRQPVPFTKGALNAYRAAVPYVETRVRLLREGRALADEPYVISGAPPGTPTEGRSGAQGEVSLELPVTTHLVHLRLENAGITVPVAVGDLDPIEEPSGLRQRLANLGQDAAIAGRGSASLAASPARERDALVRFQRSRGITETGVADEPTRSALAATHAS